MAEAQSHSLLCLPPSLLGDIFSRLGPDNKHRASFFSSCKAVHNTSDVRAQITKIKIGKGAIEAVMRFPGITLKSMSISAKDLAAAGTEWSTAARERLADLEELQLSGGGYMTKDNLTHAEQQVVRDVCSTCPKLQRLAISEDDTLQVFSTPQLIARLRSLCVIAMTDGPDFQHESFITLVSTFKNLEHLTLGVYVPPVPRPTTFDLSRLKALKNLKSLSLKDMRVRELEQVLSTCPVQHLEIQDAGVGLGTTTLCPHVRNIRYLGTPSTLNSMRWLLSAQLPSLQQFILGPVQPFLVDDEEGYHVLGPVPSPAGQKNLLCHGDLVECVAAKLSQYPVCWAGENECRGYKTCFNFATSSEFLESFAFDESAWEGHVYDMAFGLSGQVRAILPLKGSSMGMGLRLVFFQYVQLVPAALAQLSEIFPNVTAMNLDEGAIVENGSLATIVRCFRALSELLLNVEVKKEHLDEAREAAQHSRRDCALKVHNNYTYSIGDEHFGGDTFIIP